jgi:hypothetical protein
MMLNHCIERSFLMNENATNTLSGTGDTSGPSGGTGTDAVLSGSVSGGDAADSVYTPAPASASETPVPASEAYSEYPVSGSDTEGSVLSSVDMKLSIIIFLLLFFWCHARIRNAVRGFTGRKDR